jgi:hypothetical protein
MGSRYRDRETAASRVLDETSAMKFGPPMSKRLVMGLALSGYLALAGCGPDSGRAAGSSKPSASASASSAKEEEAARLAAFYESFVRAIAENVDDCDRMAKALESAGSDDARVKAFAGLQTRDDPKLAALLDPLIQQVDARHPKFEAGIRACGKTPAVRDAMKKFALAQ